MQLALPAIGDVYGEHDAAVDNMPIVATAVPKRPPIASPFEFVIPLQSPHQYALMMRWR